MSDRESRCGAGRPGFPAVVADPAAVGSAKSPKKSPENRPESLTSFRATNSHPERQRQRSCKCTRSAESGSAPERIRTSDLRFRRPTLYPAELRAQLGG